MRKQYVKEILPAVASGEMEPQPFQRTVVKVMTELLGNFSLLDTVRQDLQATNQTDVIKTLDSIQRVKQDAVNIVSGLEKIYLFKKQEQGKPRSGSGDPRIVSQDGQSAQAYKESYNSVKEAV